MTALRCSAISRVALCPVVTVWAVKGPRQEALDGVTRSVYPAVPGDYESKDARKRKQLSLASFTSDAARLEANQKCEPRGMRATVLLSALWVL